MTDPTPAAMLQLYRRKSHSFENEQAAKFNAMPLKDRLELLFYMMMHTNAAVQFIHQKIEFSAAETQGMPEPTKGH